MFIEYTPLHFDKKNLTLKKKKQEVSKFKAPFAWVVNTKQAGKQETRRGGGEAGRTIKKIERLKRKHLEQLLLSHNLYFTHLLHTFRT